MNRWLLYTTAGLLALWISACVSKESYLELETNLALSREAEQQSNQELEGLQTRYVTLKAEYDRLNVDLRRLQHENLQLSNDVADLTSKLDRKRKVVQQREKVINETEEGRLQNRRNEFISTTR